LNVANINTIPGEDVYFLDFRILPDYDPETYFQRIDFDKDGAITQKDFEGMAERFVSSEKLDAKRGEELKKKLLTVWEKYLKGAQGGAAINQATFIETLKKQVSDPSLREALAGPLPLFFSAVDANGDGMIQSDEFELFFSIIGLDPKMAPETFKAIDTNNDGSLSLDEFVTAGVDFFTSEDQTSPNRLFWGPLV
jgi:Ca2+-binding EF-hand superfamily protein